MNKLTVIALSIILAACASDNEHFCSKYSYLYKQLQDPDVPPLSEVRENLNAKLKDPSKDHDQPRMMMFVLNDFEMGGKPDHLTAREYCLQAERWKHYK